MWLVFGMPWPYHGVSGGWKEEEEEEENEEEEEKE